mmetsp:Transcript_19707/g.34647  ORF Transcript_19707/g.34647 Transcript_19707/m.34647 type:complete len:515 (-) Transcript_19707:10-1554(-)
MGDDDQRETKKRRSMEPHSWNVHGHGHERNAVANDEIKNDHCAVKNEEETQPNNDGQGRNVDDYAVQSVFFPTSEVSKTSSCSRGKEEKEEGVHRDILFNVASYLNHQDRLRLAAACKTALEVVELLCLNKMKAIRMKHLQHGGLESFKIRLRQYKNHPSLMSFRYQLWVALHVPVYRIDIDSFGDKRPGMNRPGTFHVHPNGSSVFGISRGIYGGFGLWNNKIRKSCGLVLGEKMNNISDDVGNQKYFWNPSVRDDGGPFWKLLITNGGDSLLAFHNQRSYGLYRAVRDIFDSGKVTWDFQRTVNIPALDQCISTHDNISCVYVRQAENDTAEVGTLDAHSGILEPRFVIHVREELHGDSNHPELALCNHRWLLVLIRCTGIVVYDLVKKEKVHFIKGRFHAVAANPHKLSAIYALTEPRNIDCLEINDDSGHLHWVSSFKIDFSSYYGFAVDFKQNYVFVSMGNRFLVYKGESGELLRIVHCPGFGGQFSTPFICTMRRELLISTTKELPYV